MYQLVLRLDPPPDLHLPNRRTHPNPHPMQVAAHVAAGGSEPAAAAATAGGQGAGRAGQRGRAAATTGSGVRAAKKVSIRVRLLRGWTCGFGTGARRSSWVPELAGHPSALTTASSPPPPPSYHTYKQEPADLVATSEDEESSDEEAAQLDEPNSHQALVPAGAAAGAKRCVGWEDGAVGCRGGYILLSTAESGSLRSSQTSPYPICHPKQAAGAPGPAGAGRPAHGIPAPGGTAT